MGKKLIITEKPSVARDFAKVLNVSGNKDGYIENNEYVISWCVGHLVGMLYPEDYDSRYAKWKLEDLPFLPKEYKLGVLKPVEKQYNTVHALLHREDIDTVYWAGDSGKEGQTIEENIRNFGGVRNGMTELRVWIDSMTNDEIKRGINEAKSMKEYENLGKSGIMRTIEDYALGINFSRALSIKYGKLINDAAATKKYTAIAVGRVMTCVLGMVVFREREIRNFTETPFYRVIGNITDEMIPAEWKSIEGSKYFNSPLLYKENGFKNESDANALIDFLSGKEAFVENVEKNTSKKKAPLLFNISELQAECAKRFKITPDETLQIAQDLYEHKMTTYPRTDARVLTTAIAKEISKNLNGLLSYEPTKSFAEKIINEKLFSGIEKTQYTNDSLVTDHYAIIPTGVPYNSRGLSELHGKVYDLIVRRFLSIFYPPAEYLNVKLTIKIDTELLFSSSKVLKVKGYMEIAGVSKSKDEDDAEVSDESKRKIISLADTLKKGDLIEVKSYEIKEGKTSPPKRYTEGTMILAMENAGNLIEDEELREQIKKTGIGTSATRAGILKKLIDIGYLNENKKTLILTPSNLGEMIFEVVNMSIPSLLNPEMTASWEKGLEGIINGTVDANDYRIKLEKFIADETRKMIGVDLTGTLAGKINPFTGKDAKGAAARKPLPVNCPKCSGVLTTTSFGYGCSNYWDKENKCDFSVGKIAGIDLEEEDFINLIEKHETGVINGFVNSKKKKFKASLKLIKNENNEVKIEFDFSKNTPDVLEGVSCPLCGGDILYKSFGYGCSNYDKEKENSCKFSIGKISGKDLKEADVVKLLKEGHTDTIRGFKSKNGSKFDAVLTLNKDAEGKVTGIGFDFDNVEAKVIKDIKCKNCGGDIIKTSYGYRCVNYVKDDVTACKFVVGKVAGKDLTEANIRELLTNGRTSQISGFKSKKNSKFDAALEFDIDDNGKAVGVKFYFEQFEPEEIEAIKCPICNAKIFTTKFGYACENYKREENSCTFSVGNVLSHEVTREELKALVTNGETDKISGFVSKKGASFDAKLILTKDEDGKPKGIGFSFD